MGVKKDKKVKEVQESQGSSVQKYQVDEKVLCYHGALPYEAKIQDVKYDEEANEYKYHVHYHGWNAKWDEWVNDLRIMMNDEAGQKLKEQLFAAQSSKETSGRKSSKSARKSQGAAGAGSSTAGHNEATNSSSDPTEKAALPSASEGEPEKDVEATTNEGEADEDEDVSSVTTSQASSKRAAHSKNTSQQPPSSTASSSSKKRASKATTHSTPNAVSTTEVATTASSKSNSRKRTHTTSEAASDSTAPSSEPQATLKPSIAPVRNPHHADLLRMYPLQLTYPPAVRDWLVFDCTSIQRQCKWHSLPAAVPVTRILTMYKSQGGLLKAENEPVDDMQEEFCAGLKDYFDLLLPYKLLYKEEQEQWSKFSKLQRDPVVPSQMYGAAHLLRLIVKLRDLVPYTKVDESALKILAVMANDFLEFMAENMETFYPNRDDVCIKREVL